MDVVCFENSCWVSSRVCAIASVFLYKQKRKCCVELFYNILLLPISCIISNPRFVLCYSGMSLLGNQLCIRCVLPINLAMSNLIMLLCFLLEDFLLPGQLKGHA